MKNEEVQIDELTAPRISQNGALIFPEKSKTENTDSWIWEKHFGIPEPSFIPISTNLKFFRHELRILYLDFSTKVFISEGCDPYPARSHMRLGLKDVAFTDPLAIAFELISYVKKNPDQEFEQSHMLNCFYRIDKDTWRSKYLGGNDFKVINRFDD